MEGGEVEEGLARDGGTCIGGGDGEEGVGEATASAVSLQVEGVDGGGGAVGGCGEVVGEV